MAKKGQYIYEYPHPAVTADCVVFGYDGKELKVLLIKRGKEKEASTTAFVGEWALPGGFLDVEKDRNVTHTAARELREETGLKLSVKEFKEVGTFSDIKRDPRERVITIAWYALVKPHEVVGGDDAAEAAWFPVDDLPPLAFDHHMIFEAAMERLRRDIHFQPVGFDLLDDEFTIPDLQRLYEAILGVKFDRRNFQRKILASGILDSVGKEEPGEDVICCSESEPLFVPDLAFEGACDSVQEEHAMPSPAPEGSPETAAPKKGRQGRRGILFRLNRRRYEEMKEDGLKQEF